MVLAGRRGLDSLGSSNATVSSEWLSRINPKKFGFGR
jgi:hypothetical protein